MASKTLSLSIPSSAARDRATQFFTQNGWRVSADTNGNLRLERGSRTMSFLFGAMAGKNLYLSHYVDFADTPDGGSTVTYSSTVGSAIMGGAIGVNKSNGIHADTWPQLADALHKQGVLRGVQ